MSNIIYGVENPVYLAVDQIYQQYDRKHVLLTNIEFDKKMLGGVVRYYGHDVMPELRQKISELRTVEGDSLGSCTVMWIGGWFGESIYD